MFRTSRLTFLTTLLVVASAASACRDKAPEMDVDLARDIALASEAQQQSQLIPEDTALAPAPEKKPAATPSTPSRTTTTPRRETQVARQPAPSPSRPRVEPPAVVERTPDPAPEPTPAPAPAMRGILAGTSFGLTTKGQVCTNGNRAGDKIVATVTSDVRGEGGAMIPAGSSVVLEVASVTPGDSPESAQIELRVRSVVLDGVAHNVAGDVTLASELERTQVAREEGSDKKKVIGGAIAGALIGQVIGKDTKSTVIGAAAGAAAGAGAAALSKKYDACLPAGSNVRVTTSAPIPLSA